MEAKKANYNLYHQSIAIIGMFVIAASSLAGKNVQPYLIFTTIAIMLVSVFIKIRREIADGVFDKTKYITAAWILLFLVGFFICYRFFAI